MVVPETLPDPIAVAVSFTNALERLDVPYLIGGSFASSVHGEPRSTNDIDIVADLREEHVTRFVELVRGEYYVSEEAVREAIRLGGSFNVLHMGAAVKIDVFIAGDDPFNRERLQSRARVLVASSPQTYMFLDTAEHSILRKLEWYRRGGEVSDRQWRDVLAILRVQGSRLDQSRLHSWADRLGVSDLLGRALEDAKLED